MFHASNQISKDTYGININLILNDIKTIIMRIKLIFNLKCKRYNQIIHF